jgi:uncharacterized protein YbjT (DUF2867 family)
MACGVVGLLSRVPVGTRPRWLKIAGGPVRVLLTGATGLIGSAVLARLLADGHEVVAVARNIGGRERSAPGARWLGFDIAQATSPSAWLPHLGGVDAVVNCAGILQDSPSDSTAGVHVAGAAALFAACELAGVRRVVHLSAIGVDRETPTPFSRTKRKGDEALMARALDWVILRPSVVVGRPAYGGSALFRGLAALPILPSARNTASLQVVQLDELVATVLFFLRPEAPTRLALDVAGPQRLSMDEVVAAFRSWLRWPDARVVRLPEWLSALLYRLGDCAGLLGWRPPIRSTARREIVRGAVGDPSEWRRATGIEPQSLRAALAAEPASVQERWFAGLYFLKPLVLGVLALFWIGTGLISLGPGWEIGLGLMEEGGAATVGPLVVVAGALADIVIGAGIAIRRTSRLALWAGFVLSIVYAIIGTILIPRLWADPLGPMLKIWPIIVLHLVALAMLDDR